MEPEETHLCVSWGMELLGLCPSGSWQSCKDPADCKGETEPQFLKRGKTEGAQWDDGGDPPGKHAENEVICDSQHGFTTDKYCLMW